MKPLKLPFCVLYSTPLFQRQLINVRSCSEFLPWRQSLAHRGMGFWSACGLWCTRHSLHFLPSSWITGHMLLSFAREDQHWFFFFKQTVQGHTCIRLRRNISHLSESHSPAPICWVYWLAYSFLEGFLCWPSGGGGCRILLGHSCWVCNVPVGRTSWRRMILSG